ncbi:uncharacterized protein TRIVIDRAFT_207115 [Trichoderma virens Gv29-8]|uniref:Uncharacterized protein n=1 Tax=Hypocrea virens (strain Gv29-8 / FGSC 10586) TaxID=413071 RepID=G9NCF0_HYPVG|nr:uncharacterized protein TRIVIDRAFT_207115 [Trichoderma virens Gv29-8]EHK15374.1 hypothetical protein TRIVIDRAFT_207115 [Trichoderma virens Gv29-8]UKZ51315.1 hypothetical protein TrVGV298_005073 [Trichoderma virens]
MLYTYDSQYTDGDFIWQPNNTETINLETHNSAGRLLPTSFSEKVFSEAQSEVKSEPLDFLTSSDLFNPNAAIPHEHDLDIDLSLDWRAPDLSSNQFSNLNIIDNTVVPLQNINQPLVPFGQQLLVHSFSDSYFEPYPEHTIQDNPLSAYPPLDFDYGTNSLSYGPQVIQQFGQPYNNNVNFGFNQHENPTSPEGRNQSSLGTQKHLFTYTPKGQWLRDRCFTKEQLREYADNCGKDTVFWVQQAPTQCNHRLEPEDRMCRWANCPVANRTITAGWLRVAFDEFPHLTSSGARDPLKCAGSLHLWCFEQIFDPTEFHLCGRLRPEDRQFPFEDKSVVTLEKLTDAGIIREAYQPWFEQNMFSLNQQPREYRDSLSYRLTKYHIENQTAARQKARSKRNDTKSVGERRTIDVHLGNLKMFVEITNRVRMLKKMRRLRRLRRANAEGTDSLSDSFSQPLALTNIRATRKTTRRIMTDRHPEPTRGFSLSRESHQSRGSSLANRNMQETLDHEIKPSYRRQRQSNLAQFPSVSSQNRDSNTYQVNPTLNSSMSSRQPSYFDPLNPAHHSGQSTARPSATTASTLSNCIQSSHLGISCQNDAQNVTGARFNRATRGKPRPVLRPIITQPLQQYPYSVNPSTSLDAFAHTTGEILQLPGASRNTCFFDSRRLGSPTHEVPDFGLHIDPRISEVELEVGQHQEEAVSEANDAFPAHTLTFPVASQPPGIMDGAVSPRVTATSPYWDSLVDFGGFGGAFPTPLLTDFSATNGVDGDRVATLTGASIQHVSSPEVARIKRETLSPIEATQSGRAAKDGARIPHNCRENVRPLAVVKAAGQDVTSVVLAWREPQDARNIPRCYRHRPVS